MSHSEKDNLPRHWVILAGLIAVMLMPSVAQAQSTFYACYTKSGLVYRVNPPSTPGEDPNLEDACSSNKHVWFSWNEEGIQGVQGASGVSGYEEKFTLSAHDNSSPKTQEASCPLGKVVLGGGANVAPTVGNPLPKVAITRSLGFLHATTNLYTWQVSAQAFTSEPNPWTLVSVIYCADTSP